jgi:hypothetical protein
MKSNKYFSERWPITSPEPTNIQIAEKNARPSLTWLNAPLAAQSAIQFSINKLLPPCVLRQCEALLREAKEGLEIDGFFDLLIHPFF